MKRFLFLLLFLPFVVCSQHPAFIAPGIAGTKIPQVTYSLPAPDFWINGNDAAKYSHSVDQGGRLIDVVTSADASALTSTALSSGSLRFKPSYNGEAEYFNGGNGYTFGSVSTFKNLHNGTAFTIYLTLKQLPMADGTTQQNIFRTTTTNQNTQTGITLYYINDSGNSKAKTIRVALLNSGGGATGQFDVTCSQNSIIDNEYNNIKIVFTGSVLTVYVKNSTNPSYTSKGTDGIGSGLSSANSAAVMTVGGTTGWRGYLKQFITYYRNLSTPDQTAAEAWITNETTRQVTLTDASVYFAWGQSNMWGVAANSGLPGDITGDLGAMIFWPPSNVASNGQAYWDNMVVGTTTNASVSNQHGAMLRFAKNMVAGGVQPWIIMKGIGSTILIPNGISTWSALSPVGSGDLYPLYRDQNAFYGLDEIIHVYRKNPIIKGLIKMQGESDAGNNVTNCQHLYETEWSGWIKTFTDYVATQGISTNKMRVANPRIHDSTDPGWIAVQAAETNVMDSFLIQNPTYSPKVKGTKWIDTNGLGYAAPHYTAAAYDSIGKRLARYFLTYADEYYVDSVTYTVDEIQYVGKPFTISTTAPTQTTGGTFAWTVIQSDANNMAGWIKTTSTSKSPTFTLDSLGRYDIRIQATSTNTLDNYKRARITVLPALPSNPATGYDYLVDLDAIMGSKGSAFSSSATASVTNGSATVTTSAAHGVVQYDWVRLAVGAHFYQAQSGTTGSTLILDRVYEGTTGTVSAPRNYGHEATYNSPVVTYDLDGDVLDTGGHSATTLLDDLGNDTGVTVRIRAGENIAFRGEFLGYFQMHNWVGTFIQPIHFYNIGQVNFYGYYGALPYPWEWSGKMQNIIVDGHADTNYTYGINFYCNQTRPGQAWILGGRWNRSLIVTGCDVPYTGNDSADSYGYDPVFAAHNNTVATGTSGASTLTLASAITTIPSAGQLVIHTVGTTYASGTSHFYNYSSYDAGTKVFTLTTPLSQNYTAGWTVNVNICSEYNWYHKRLWWVKNSVSATNGGNDESWYVGFNNNSRQTNGFIPSHMEDVKIYRNFSASSGRDGIQPTSCHPRLEVTNNDIRLAGRKNDFTHTSALSFNDANKGIVAFNQFLGSKEMTVMQTGKDTGGGDCYIASNIWDTREWSIDGGAVESIFIGIETGGPALVDYHWFNNTIVTDLRPAATIQHNDPSNSQSLNFTFAGNAISQEGSQTNYTEVKVNTSPAGGRGGWLIDNVLGASDNFTQFQFTDYAGGDFSIANKSSTLFGGGFDVSARLTTLPSWVFRDIDGYPLHITRETVTDWTAGAKSGYELWVHPDVTAPTLSTFYVSNAHPDRIYFTTSEEITASGTSGFTLTGTSRTISSATIVDSGSGYFTLSGNLSIGDAVTIAYNGTNTWKDVAAALNPLASFSAVSVDNQLVLIDFRVLIDVGATYTTTTDDLGRQWNNVTTFDQNTLYTPLVDATNVTSPIELYVTQNLNNTSTGTIGNSGQNASSTGYPASVWRDYHSGGNTTTAAFEFRNLPSTHKYNIRISGSRAASDANRVDEVRVQSNGTWSSWVTVDCQTNSTLFADFTDVLRDSGGKIQVEVRAKSPSTFSYIGVIDINCIVL